LANVATLEPYKYDIFADLIRKWGSPFVLNDALRVHYPDSDTQLEFIQEIISDMWKQAFKEHTPNIYEFTELVVTTSWVHCILNANTAFYESIKVKTNPPLVPAIINLRPYWDNVKSKLNAQMYALLKLGDGTLTAQDVDQYFYDQDMLKCVQQVLLAVRIVNLPTTTLSQLAKVVSEVS
jgi:hypothetical protein